jgi:hypothetical protein
VCIYVYRNLPRRVTGKFVWCDAVRIFRIVSVILAKQNCDIIFECKGKSILSDNSHHSSFEPFPVKTDSQALTVIPVCHELETTRFRLICKKCSCPFRCRESIWGYRVIAPHILNIGNGWRSVVTFRPRPISLRERASVHIGWEAGWAP